MSHDRTQIPLVAQREVVLTECIPRLTWSSFAVRDAQNPTIVFCYFRPCDATNFLLGERALNNPGIADELRCIHRYRSLRNY